MLNGLFMLKNISKIIEAVVQSEKLIIFFKIFLYLMSM